MKIKNLKIICFMLLCYKSVLYAEYKKAECTSYYSTGVDVKEIKKVYANSYLYGCWGSSISKKAVEGSGYLEIVSKSTSSFNYNAGRMLPCGTVIYVEKGSKVVLAPLIWKDTGDTIKSSDGLFYEVGAVIKEEGYHHLCYASFYNSRDINEKKFCAFRIIGLWGNIKIFHKKVSCIVECSERIIKNEIDDKKMQESLCKGLNIYNKMMLVPILLGIELNDNSVVYVNGYNIYGKCREEPSLKMINIGDTIISVDGKTVSYDSLSDLQSNHKCRNNKWYVVSRLGYVKEVILNDKND